MTDSGQSNITLKEALAGRRWKRAKCPVCGREFALSPKSGLLHQHTRGFILPVECPGSRKAPR